MKGLFGLGVGIGLFLSTAPAAPAQVVFSIDYGGPTISIPDCSFGVPITEGDVLGVCTAVAAPVGAGMILQPWIASSGGFGPPALGLGMPAHPAAIGHPSEMAGGVELDALSFGLDDVLRQIDYPNGKIFFSVDNFSLGFVTILPPAVFSEGPLFEQAADVFESLGLPLSFPLPFPPAPLPPGGNTGKYDANGVPGPSIFAYPAMGLKEPTIPAPPTQPLPGDNLDALDTEVPLPLFFPFYPQGGIYFSLEGRVVDPITGVAGSGSAAINGFVGGDVLWTPVAGGPPVVYAPAPVLGLDLVAPNPDFDDVDALALWENGIPGYQPSVAPYDWLSGQTDMLLFSVRRGSAVIGRPDSISGLPIEEGDVLTSPAVPGLSPFPGILIPGEFLGFWTARSNGPGPLGPGGDDLNALDIRQGVDAIVPDCTGDVVPCPCGNASGAGAMEGCVHSSGFGMKLDEAPGSGSSVSAGNLDVMVTQIPMNPLGPPGNSGLYLVAAGPGGAGSVFDGFNCVGGGPRMLPGADLNNDGVRNSGDIIGQTNALFPGFMVPGSTYWFQYWSRDVLCGPPPAPCPSPCGTNANFSNAGMATLVP